MISCRVKANQEGTRLVDFLAQQQSCSRRKAKLLLDRRCVFVNRQIVWMAQHQLVAGDTVEIRGATDQYPRLQLSRIYGDERLLVVDKPPGYLSVGRSSIEAHLRRSLGSQDVHAAHRLDRDTSGCLIFALDLQTFEALKTLFRERAIYKTYKAIVHGHFPEAERTFRSPVRGAAAVTKVQLLKAGKTASLLRCIPQTGRTHQIRKHLAEQGYPIVGDSEYGPKKIVDPLLRCASRQMLHACSLVFLHPHTQKNLRCDSRTPHDFATMLRRLHLNR